ASSEHSSVRGTINGGGDFIYVPQPDFGMELASVSLAPPAMQQGAQTQSYLGVQVQDTVDGATVKMVQIGSPAEQAGLLVGDLVTSVNGIPVDSQNPLAVLISGYSGGDWVEMGVLRNGAAQTATVTLASMLLPVLVTPSAEITVTDNTEFVIDIGLNGATALHVLADTAHVREPVTGSEEDVPAGMAVIVLTGYEVGDPIPFGAGDINAWWQPPKPAATVQPQPAAEPDTPSPTTLFLMGLATVCLCLILSIVVVVVIVIVIRKIRRPVNPPYSPD
ncbi:MAG: PDZ domain-containing protein, partial [Anaerolineales bacterium]|nr:PDZ domain-containing protein [Anaerolineales bacterium]